MPRFIGVYNLGDMLDGTLLVYSNIVMGVTSSGTVSLDFCNRLTGSGENSSQILKASIKDMLNAIQNSIP